MRILHVLDHSVPLHSGYTFRTLAILREQRALGWQTYHLTSAKQGRYSAPQEEIEGLRFCRTPPPSRVLQGLPGVGQWAIAQGLALRLEEMARQVSPDILHAHSPVLNAMAALRVGRKLGIPVVYEVRAFWEDAAVDHGTSREWGLRYRLSRSIETYALKRADAVTTLCEGLRRDIVARGIPSEKVTVIPNAVDIDRFRLAGEPDASLKARLGLQSGRVLGFIGSFYVYEGLHLLLQALPEILHSAPDTRVLLIGGGPQDASLKRLAHTLAIEDKVIFRGRVPHDEVQRCYDLIDILVYPRIPIRLTELVTPLKPLEAMAQGRLVLASDVGGHRELIRDGETGILFKAGNAAALAARVLELFEHRERWSRLKVAGRRFVETERHWRASVARYRAIYGHLGAQGFAAHA